MDEVPAGTVVRPGELVIDLLLMRICGSLPGRWEGYPVAGGSPEGLWMRIAFAAGPIVAAKYEGAMWEAVRYGRADCASLLHNYLGVGFVNKYNFVETIPSPAIVRLLGKWKSADPEWLLRCAAVGNNVSGMRAARKLGAKDFWEALWTAEEHGCLETYLRLSLWINSE